jgi:hypothetical protein
MSAGDLGWLGVLFPTEAHAQDAQMSLAEYERFVFRACHVEEPGDPVAHWQGVRDELGARAERSPRPGSCGSSAPAPT